MDAAPHDTRSNRICHHFITLKTAVEAYPENSKKNLTFTIKWAEGTLSTAVKNKGQRYPVQCNPGSTGGGEMCGISDVLGTKAARGAPDVCIRVGAMVRVGTGTGHVHRWCYCTGITQETAFAGPAPLLAYGGETSGMNFIL